jgi:hypothetical protein
MHPCLELALGLRLPQARIGALKLRIDFLRKVVQVLADLLPLFPRKATRRS